MKKKLLFVFVAVALWSCGDNKEDKDGNEENTEHHEGHEHGDGHDHDHGDGHDHDHGDEVSWPEADAFHEYMASTWHPAEEGDFEPITAKARDMADAAKAWSESAIPETYDKDGVPDLLNMIRDESEALADLVDSGAESDTVFVALEALHNLFHQVVEKCSPGEHDHDHDHGDHDHGDHDHHH